MDWRHSQPVTCGADDVVEFAADVLEQRLDVILHVWGRQVAGVACEAVAGGGVGLEELFDRAFDTRLRRGRDYHCGAVFEGGFRDGVAYAGAATDDEDPAGGELGRVFLRVGHVTGDGSVSV